MVTDPGAGHRLVLPGEEAVVGGRSVDHGGSPAADRAIGARAWSALTGLLEGRPA